jgi:hypothetical protein
MHRTLEEVGDEYRAIAPHNNRDVEALVELLEPAAGHGAETDYVLVDRFALQVVDRGKRRRCTVTEATRGYARHSFPSRRLRVRYAARLHAWLRGDDLAAALILDQVAQDSCVLDFLPGMELMNLSLYEAAVNRGL